MKVPVLFFMRGSIEEVRRPHKPVTAVRFCPLQSSVKDFLTGSLYLKSRSVVAITSGPGPDNMDSSSIGTIDLHIKGWKSKILPLVQKVKMKKKKREDNAITSQFIFNRDVWLEKSKEREENNDNTG